MNLLPRYLVEFRSKRIVHRFTDILILGGGLAGLRAALACDPQLDVLVATKDKIRQSNSNYAQGGIASVVDPADRLEWHIRDTLVAGASLCDYDVVKMVVEKGPQCIQDLVEMGAQFDQADGDLTLGREGGHSHNRIIHALGDATGQEIMRAVINRTKSTANISILEDTFTIDLLTDENRCCGAIVAQNDQLQMIWAKQTILATGGAGQVYRETTNPAVATADGHALAIRAGVITRDMEFMQFHPTVLYIAGGSRSLITEAVRGEGAHLVDRDGERFMPDYDPRAELAPRDIVSQAIVAQMEKTHHPNVYLDLSHLDSRHIRQRFPGILKTCAEFGIDITQDRIPVRPGAHYMIGGVIVDTKGRTSLENLWAAGEVTSSGLHGANRLASNSLLEGLVYGVLAGEGASVAARQDPRPNALRPLEYSHPKSTRLELDLADIRNSLKSLMWRAVGVRRTADELAEAAETLVAWQRLFLTQPQSTQAGWELQNMLTVSELMIVAAQMRTESRGVHFRQDFPKSHEDWRRSICFHGNEPSLSPIFGEQPNLSLP
ncbi:MAG: L-aspartate oxidase [Pirellulaceae bacterium]